MENVPDLVIHPRGKEDIQKNSGVLQPGKDQYLCLRRGLIGNQGRGVHQRKALPWTERTYEPGIEIQ